MKKTNQKGFTLIDLTIVISVVGIQAAVALTAYPDYTIRAKISEAMVTIDEAKTSVSDYFIANGRMPTDSAQAGIRTNVDTDIVQSMTFASDLITLSIKDIGGDTTAGDTFQLSLAGTAGGTPQWECIVGGGQPIDAKYLPANCR